MHLFTRLLTALTLLLALAQAPAMAASDLSGTLAWSTDALTLRSGPGTAYAITGDIGADLAIKVLRCQKLYCLVAGHGGRGWTNMQFIAFGKPPRDVHPNYAAGSTACFYTGTNYSGSEFCVPGGRVIRDLALLGIDNSFASVRVGSASVSACRDRDFQSYCERIITSQPVLDQYLARNLSSIRVH